ncbi:MAG: hypothetical protein IT158_04520, partial [Bryobacterales bacterium]|nr:hypothetical protein [Bryobacterales bacterium]
QRWFKTENFARSIAYTPRTNPRDFPGLVGPNWFSWDGTISKNFALTERFRLELRVESYNVANNFVRGNPNMTVTDSLFGKALKPRDYTFGRQTQYSLRLQF